MPGRSKGGSAVVKGDAAGLRRPFALHRSRSTQARIDVQAWAIGPILAAPAPLKSQDDDTSIIQWLDAHPRRSVLYISFGSQNSISIHQMAELALGLETSGRPFLWAVQPLVGFDHKDGFDPGWLPVGFED
uniref:Uncharacterized protein n=2 Tax=Oryza TaxID=4527 RepID=Q6K7C0_ORYSJ|nr:hypothetical protein [Oryza sativa Japonica Group]